MSIKADNIFQCSTAEVDRRKMEIQVLINVIQPNPTWQPLLITDETTLDEMTDLDASLIQARLEFYFGLPLPVPLSVRLWEFVDAVKVIMPAWPENEPAIH